MSTDSSFDDHKPDSVPTTPEPDVDPVLDPDSPLRQPLAPPAVVSPEHPRAPHAGADTVVAPMFRGYYGRTRQGIA